MRARSARTGEKCKFEHKNAVVNKLNLAVLVDYSNHTCNVCPHHLWVKKHAAEIKVATSFKGDHVWFKKETNLKAFRESVKMRC